MFFVDNMIEVRTKRSIHSLIKLNEAFFRGRLAAHISNRYADLCNCNKKFMLSQLAAFVEFCYSSVGNFGSPKKI